MALNSGVTRGNSYIVALAVFAEAVNGGAVTLILEVSSTGGSTSTDQRLAYVVDVNHSE
jgi:hypothetical protein